MMQRAGVKNYLTCADCPDAYKEDWTKKREALRCGSPERGDGYHYVVQLYPVGNTPDSVRPAPAWCPRRTSK